KCGETKMFVEGFRRIVLGMNHDPAHASDFGDHLGSPKRVAQEARAQTLPVEPTVNGNARDDHDGDRMARQPFPKPLGRIVKHDIADGEAVKSRDDLSDDRDIGLRAVGSLAVQRMDAKKSIQRLHAAIELSDDVSRVELLDMRLGRCRAQSKTLGSFRSCSRRAWRCGGASSASMNALHCSALSLIERCSANTSSARMSALWRTNSVTDLRSAAAASWRRRLSWAERRKSSFALRVGRLARADRAG